MPKLFLYDYDHNDMMKCRQNVNFHEIDTEPSTRKNNRFWLLLEIFEKYTKKIIMAVLRKANYHSVVICRLITGPSEGFRY